MPEVWAVVQCRGPGGAVKKYVCNDCFTEERVLAGLCPDNCSSFKLAGTDGTIEVDCFIKLLLDVCRGKHPWSKLKTSGADVEAPDEEGRMLVTVDVVPIQNVQEATKAPTHGLTRVVAPIHSSPSNGTSSPLEVASSSQPKKQAKSDRKERSWCTAPIEIAVKFLPRSADGVLKTKTLCSTDDEKERLLRT